MYAGVIVTADQLVKVAAVKELQHGNGVSLIGDWFSLVLTRNPGAAFSFGAGGSTWVFTLLAITVVAGTVWFFPRLSSATTRAAATLLIGGATGNLLDRLLRSPGFGKGHVVDYIKIGNFPIFNIADMSITAAAGLFVISALRPTQRHGLADER